jgi:hypothetical protein
VALALATASASSVKVHIGATGPKISSPRHRLSGARRRARSGRRRSRARHGRATGERRAPLADGVLDELVDPSRALAGDERADVDTLLGALADGERAHPGGELGRELLGDGLVDEEPVGGRAGLTDVAHLGEHRAVDRRVDVGVLEDEEGGVAAELHRQAQQLLGRLLDEHLADRRWSR